MFALSLGVFITLLPFAAALALVMAGYGASEMDDPLTIVVFGGLYASWFGIPVFLIAIALKSARTERAAAAAWIGAIVWFALTGWMYFGSS